MTTTARILMCPPDFFGVHYEINPWMSVQRGSRASRSLAQWLRLRAILEACGAEVLVMPPAPGLPDLVFTANAALVLGNRAVISRFRCPQRQGEESLYADWLALAGFDVVTLPPELHFEGAGDALFLGDTLYAGYPHRSTAAALHEISRRYNIRVLPLELVDPRFYHLDTCFCPLSESEAIYFPDAFDRYAQRVLEANVPHLIAVEEDEAVAFACNAAVVGRCVVTNEGAPKLHAALARRGYTPIAAPLDEFLKAGGAAKCLTLRLDGEEAAAWRRLLAA